MLEKIFNWILGLFEAAFDWLIGLLPDWMGSGWDQLASAFGPLAQYLAWLMALDVVAPTILGAYGIRFLIRRLPIIG